MSVEIGKGYHIYYYYYLDDSYEYFHIHMIFCHTNLALLLDTILAYIIRVLTTLDLMGKSFFCTTITISK